jgi:hypothetical protein
MDNPFNLPTTPVNASEASDNDNDDTSSLLSFNFDAPADVAPEGASFKEHASTPSRARMSESIRNLGIFLNNKRRAAVQGAMRGGATAWIDQDDSGTYDPKRERATPDECGPVKKVKRRKIAGGDEGEDGEGKSRREKMYRNIGFSLVVTLTLASEVGREYLRSITPGPTESEPSDSDDDSSDSSTDSDSGYGSFPKRRRKRQPKRLGTWTSRYSPFPFPFFYL